MQTWYCDDIPIPKLKIHFPFNYDPKLDKWHEVPNMPISRLNTLMPEFANMPISRLNIIMPDANTTTFLTNVKNMFGNNKSFLKY